MSECKWTPGPWGVGLPNLQEHYGIGISNNEMHICDVCDDGVAQGSEQANAQLIAAAPDLYEALEDIFNIQFEADGGGSPGSPIEKARAALAKARGE